VQYLTIKILYQKMSRAVLNNENISPKSSRVILNNEKIPPIEAFKSKEKENRQNIDTRLIINNETTMTAGAFINIIREYMCYDISPIINETEAYIINHVECPYKRKRAYQTEVRERKTRLNFSIAPSDSTPTYTPADSLASVETPHHNINTVRLHSSTKRKTARVKFRTKRLSRNKDNGEIFTTAINAQGNTGANCSATDTIDIIHNYVKFSIPQDVGVFSDDE
jgi:hypothetical protein